LHVNQRPAVFIRDINPDQCARHRSELAWLVTRRPSNGKFWDKGVIREYCREGRVSAEPDARDRRKIDRGRPRLDRDHTCRVL